MLCYFQMCLVSYIFMMFLSLGTATSITVSWSLITPRCLVDTCLPIWIWKSHRILALLFSSTFCGISHLNLGVFSPYTVQMFLYIMLITWLCCSMYVVPACNLYLTLRPVYIVCTYNIQDKYK